MSRKSNKKKNELRNCVYCGEYTKCTDEHVIARCLYPDEIKPTKDGFVIVKACLKCNGSKSKEDSYMRDRFAVDAAVYDKPICRSLMKTVLRSHLGNRSDLCRTALVKHRFTDDALFMPTASYLGPYVSIPLNIKRERSYLRSIVQGLYWEMTRQRIPEFTFDYSRIKPVDYGYLLMYFIEHNAMRPVAIGEGVFDWTVMFGLEDPSVTCWLFRFYEGIYYYASTQHNRRMRKHSSWTKVESPPAL